MSFICDVVDTIIHKDKDKTRWFFFLFWILTRDIPIPYVQCGSQWRMFNDIESDEQITHNLHYPKLYISSNKFHLLTV